MVVSECDCRISISLGTFTPNFSFPHIKSIKKNAHNFLNITTQVKFFIWIRFIPRRRVGLINDTFLTQFCSCDCIDKAFVLR